VLAMILVKHLHC